MPDFYANLCQKVKLEVLIIPNLSRFPRTAPKTEPLNPSDSPQSINRPQSATVSLNRPQSISLSFCRS